MDNRTSHMARVLISLLLLVALAACAGDPVVPFTPAAPAHADAAQVYVYWPGQTWRERGQSSLELRVDGAPMGILRYKRYIPLEIPPGNHEFRLTGESAEANWKGRDQAFELKLKPGEVLYARLLIKYDQQKNTWTNPGMSYVVQFLPRNPREARLEMADLKPSRD